MRGEGVTRARLHTPTPSLLFFPNRCANPRDRIGRGKKKTGLTTTITPPSDTLQNPETITCTHPYIILIEEREYIMLVSKTTIIIEAAEYKQPKLLLSVSIDDSSLPPKIG
jgi:hypothetical protein